jgi:hypothetical protein
MFQIDIEEVPVSSSFLYSINEYFQYKDDKDSNLNTLLCGFNV